MSNFKTDPRAMFDYLARSYVEHQNLIRFADTKANIVLALSGVILSLFFNFFIARGNASMLQAMIVLVPFVLAGFFAFLALYPRIGKKTQAKSLLYYRDAEQLKPAEWLKLFEEDRAKYIAEDYLNSIKSLAKIVEKKFIYLRHSYIFFLIAILIKVAIEFSAWLG